VTPLVPVAKPDADKNARSLFQRGVRGEDGKLEISQSGPTSSSIYDETDGTVTIVPNSGYDASTPILSARRLADNGDGTAIGNDGNSAARYRNEGDFYFAETTVTDPGTGRTDVGISYTAASSTSADFLKGKPSATYSGKGFLEVASNGATGAPVSERLEGTSKLSADFGANSVQGMITAMADDGSRTMVSLDKGTIVGSDFSGASTYSSTRNPAITEQSGDYLGTFSGDYAYSAGGVFAGAATVSDGTDEGTNDSNIVYQGGFVANQDGR
jgi:hypothetical protein